MSETVVPQRYGAEFFAEFDPPVVAEGRSPVVEWVALKITERFGFDLDQARQIARLAISALGREPTRYMLASARCSIEFDPADDEPHDDQLRSAWGDFLAAALHPYA